MTESVQKLDRLSAMVGRQLTKAEKWSYGVGKLISMAGAILLFVNVVPAFLPPPTEVGSWEFQMLSSPLWLVTMLLLLIGGLLAGPIDKDEWKVCWLLCGVNLLFLFIALN